MATEFVMPKLGLTMEQGTITEWLLEDGAAVAAGDPVLVIETDKVETEVEAPADGMLHRRGTIGETFQCGEVIGFLLSDGEEPPAASTPQTTAAPTAAPAAPSDGPAAAAEPTAAASPPPARVSGGRILASPNARRLAAERNVALRDVPGTGPGGRIVSEDVVEFASRPAPVKGSVATPGAWGSPTESSTVPATVAARQLADLLGIDLRAVEASSGDGRRSREDVAAHVRRLLDRLAERGTPPAPQGDPVLQDPVEIIPFTGMRGAIATRMHASLTEMAQLTLHLDATMDAVIADRAARKAAGAAPGYTDYVIAATARALRDHPIVNSQVTEDGIAVLGDIHVGMAVAVEGGLVVPVVRHADHLDLGALAAETSRLAEAARSKRLGLPDLEGGTFSVSALGMYGVDGFTPVINTPNAAILGVGRLREQVTIDDGEVGATTVLTLSLTWDHRVLDGAPAAAFCARVAELLADPAALDRTP